MAEEVAADMFSTTIPPAFRLQWDVFLSFRGEDTRRGITEKLYRALVDEGIRVFRDDEGLNRGDEIAPSLIEAIEDSAASIVILSETYASSHWCLEELARICELRRRILPVFYRVDPSHVRKQEGPFKEAFYSHENRFGHDQAKRWRDAMKKVGGIAGWVFTQTSGDDDEQNLIRVLLREVLEEVNNTPVKVAAHAVGLEPRVTDLIQLLDVNSNGIKVIGLHGMGGIGKTTLAKAVYNKVLPHFKCRSFISNVREMSNKSLQNKLISELCSTADHQVIPRLGDDVDSNASAIRNIIQETDFLIVLDDVDHETQLQALGATTFKKWQNNGRSRIIVTTRNRGVLVGENYQLYEVNELNFDQALELFGHHALRRRQPTKEFLELSKKMVSLTGNLPLALEVFGSFLLDKRKITEWKDALKKLREIRPHELHDVLKISFDGLDRETQRMFLDIACFFVKMRMSREDIVEVLKGCDFKAETGVRVLEEKSLVKFTGHEQSIWMHDQLRDMGRQIVEEKSEDPGMRSRLWDRDQIITVLTNQKGTRNIEGIVMDIEKRELENGKAVVLRTEPFESIVNLRLLQINHVKLEGNFKFLPREIKWLQWQGCSLKALPSDFCTQKLAVLDLSESYIQRAWTSRTNKVAENLMVLNLRGCNRLTSLPDLTGHEKLQKIVLERCKKLIKIHDSVGSLRSLCYLDLTDCSSLIDFPSDISGMKNLQTLVLTRCSALKELPANIGSLKSLKEIYLDDTDIRKLPDSIFRLEKLEKLSLQRCKNIKQMPRCVDKLVSLKELHLNHSALQELPDSIGSLRNLEKLGLINCELLTAIPHTVGNLKLLKELLIKGSAITELPDSVGSLSYLKHLFVGGMQFSKLPDSIQGLASAVKLDIHNTSIKSLPSEIGSLRLLEKLEVMNCNFLESLPESIGSLHALTYMNIYEASITELPESIGRLENLTTLRLNNCRKLSKLPSSMGNLKSLYHLYMKETAVTKLPENFGMLSCLTALEMGKKPTQQQSKSLVLLPKSFSNLSSLEEFNARAWRICGEIPDDFEKLTALKNLNLGYNDISKLPSSLGGLVLLKKLLLPHCEKLESLPPLPSSLEELNLENCISLVTISDVSNLKILENLRLTNCEKLVDIPGLESLKSLKRLYMSNCSRCSSAAKKRLSKVYLKKLKNLSIPGSKIPDWFCQDTVSFTSNKNRKLTGVIIMVVVSLNHHIADELRYQIPAVVDILAKVFDPDKETPIFTTAMHLLGVPKTNEDHIHLCRYPSNHQMISMLKDGSRIRVTRRDPSYVQGVELKKAGIFLVLEDDDDFEGDEESLDESQLSVSERLAKFVASLGDDDPAYNSSSEIKQKMQHVQKKEEELLVKPRTKTFSFILFFFLPFVFWLLSWLSLRLYE